MKNLEIEFEKDGEVVTEVFSLPERLGAFTAKQAKKSFEKYVSLSFKDGGEEMLCDKPFSMFEEVGGLIGKSVFKDLDFNVDNLTFSGQVKLVEEYLGDLFSFNKKKV